MTDRKVVLNERRKSFRWPLNNKPLSWKLAAGRAVREGCVTERSINGLVITTARRHAPRIGARIEPVDDDQNWSTAVVRRSRQAAEGQRQFVAEIIR